MYINIFHKIVLENHRKVFKKSLNEKSLNLHHLACMNPGIVQQLGYVCYMWSAFSHLQILHIVQ